MPAGLVARKHHSLDCQIVGLSSTTGENNLVAVAPNQRANLATRVLDRFGGSATKRMAARWVAVVVREERCHRFDNARGDRRGGVKVEVNFLHVDEVFGFRWQARGLGQLL